MKSVIVLIVFFFLKISYGDPVMTTSITKNDSSLSAEARAKEWINSGHTWVFPSVSELLWKNNPSSKDNEINQMKNRLYSLEVSHNYIIHMLEAIKTNMERISYSSKINNPTSPSFLRRVLFKPTEKSKTTNENLQVLSSSSPSSLSPSSSSSSSLAAASASQPLASSIIDQSDVGTNSTIPSTEYASSSSEKPIIDANTKTNIQTTKQTVVEMSAAVNTKPINHIIFPSYTSVNSLLENTTTKNNNTELSSDNNSQQFDKIRKNARKPSGDDK